MILTYVPARSRRRGFSLTEWLVVIVIVGILASIFVPYFGKIRENDRRVRCEDNLRAIMEGLQQYATLKDSRDTETHKFRPFPSTVHDKAQTGYTAYTGADAPDPFAKKTSVKPNDVTASLWLLVRHGFVGAGRFNCPSTNQTPDPMLTGGMPVAASQRSNFTDGTHLSYSYASPFGKATNLSQDSHAGDFALMADKNPGIAGKESNVTAPAWDAAPFDLAKANSKNHGQVGQNVLYADGHVAWQTTVYCGFEDKGRHDNIFTALNASLPVRLPVNANGVCGREFGPSYANDSYLVPTEGE